MKLSSLMKVAAFLGGVVALARSSEDPIDAKGEEEASAALTVASRKSYGRSLPSAGSDDSCNVPDGRIRDVVQVSQPYPSIGIVVDGNTSDWDLSEAGHDYVGGMTADGDGGPNATRSGSLYLRYSCSDTTLCALVVAAPGYCLTGSDQWFKDYGRGNQGAVTPLPPGIKSVVDSNNKTVGWEACFSVPEGCRTGFSSTNNNYGDVGVQFNGRFRPCRLGTGSSSSGTSCSSGSGRYRNGIGLDLRCPCSRDPDGSTCPLPPPYGSQSSNPLASGTCCGGACAPIPPEQACFCPGSCKTLITCPPNKVAACGASTLPSATGTAAVTVAGCCQSGGITVLAVTSADAINITSGLPCPRKVVRTWTAALSCNASGPVGKTLTCDQEIELLDNEPPVLAGLPNDETTECQDPSASQVTATDTCEGPVTPIVTMINATGCGATKNMTRTWTATDSCGNAANASRLTWIRDTTAPTLRNVPPNATASCDRIPEAAKNVTAQDACDPAVILPALVETNGTVTSQCQAGRTITRTWTATDACGNAASQAQVITLTDTVPPDFSSPPPADDTVRCDQPIPAFAALQAQDTCGNATVTRSEVRLDGRCPHNWTIIRTWKATDSCGNKRETSQTITVYDATQPVLAGVPQNITVSCTDVPERDLTVTAHDTCDTDIQIDFNETNDIDPNFCRGGKTITRTWTATDVCGNAAYQAQAISLTDDVPPSFTAASSPPDELVSCDAKLPDFVDLKAVDSCGNATVRKHEANETRECPQNMTVTRTWTARDLCGNEVNVSQMISVFDTAAPVLSGVPASTTMACDAGPLIPLSALAVGAVDTCDSNAAVANRTETTNVVEGECKHGRTISRTWTAADACGNKASSSQVIKLTDTTPPTLVGPPNQTVDCGAAIPPPASVTGSDSCGGAVRVTMAQTNTTKVACADRNIKRVWTGLDVCGNAATHTQYLKVQDTTAPTITCPANVTIACNACTNATVACLGRPSVLDNCDASPSYTYSDSYSSLPLAARTDRSQTLVRTFTAKDDCGNSNSCTQAVTISGSLSQVKVKRTVNGTVDSRTDFRFDLHQGTRFLGSESTKGRTDGVLFDLFLNPSLTYTICERNVMAGWNCQATANGEPVALYNADAGLNESLGNLCFDFKPADCTNVLNIVFDHTRVGGCPRSAGYWNIFNKCAPGGNASLTRTNGGPPQGFFIVDDFLPMLLWAPTDRNFFICTTCGPAVQVLSSKTLTTCATSPNLLLASDPVVNLAKHLFAAQLNNKTGACLPRTVATTMKNAQTLLNSLGYLGCKQFRAPNATQAAQVRTYAATLDVYNRGCPEC